MPKKKKRHHNRDNRDQRQASQSTDSPERRQQQVISQQVRQTSITRGPLPPPEVLIRYNEAVSDGAERIIAMAEKQNDHRIREEAKVIDEDIRRQRWGLILGFIVALVGLAAASYISVFAHPAAGAVVAGADIAALTGVFIYGTRSRRAEREDRADIMTGGR